MRAYLSVLIALSACHSMGFSEPESPARALEVDTLRVSQRELAVTSRRGEARATILIEHPPTTPPAANTGALPGEDFGPAYVYMLLDRRGHVVSRGGISHLHADEWEARAAAIPTRTAEELDADLQVVIDATLLLRSEPRGTEPFRRELGDMLRTARELQGVRAPSDAVPCRSTNPPTCDPR